MNILKKIITVFFLSYKIFFKKEYIKNLNIKVEQLGPVFIKFAQMISLRSDIFDNRIIKDFEKLQTNVKNIEYNEIKNILKKDEIFLIVKKINENPLASASVAQIHTAILKNEKKVIIKIIKPGINKLINKDIKILYFFSFILMHFFKKFRRLKLLDLIDEIKAHFELELNLVNEASLIKNIKTKMINCLNLYIPNTKKNTSKNVLIMEYIDGINILNKKKIKKLNLKTEIIAQIIIESFYKQVFEYNIFHADLHPGNILITLEKKDKPILILLDFGITKKITNDEKIYLAENISAFIKKDYKKIVHLHKKAETIITKEKNEEIEKSLKNIFEKITNNKLKEINIHFLIQSIIQLGKKFNMQIQPNLFLFQKTLITIEGLCRNLNENLNLWKMSRHSIEKILIYNMFKLLYIKKNKPKRLKKNAIVILNNNKNKIKIYIVSISILNILLFLYKSTIMVN